METKEKFDERNQVNDEVVKVAAEVAAVPEAQGKEIADKDRGDGYVDEAIVERVVHTGTSVEQTEACVEQAVEREEQAMASGDNVDTSVVQAVGSEEKVGVSVGQVVESDDRDETMEVGAVVDEGMECNGAAEVAEPGGDGCGDSSVAELVERARQEGYESGYSRGYDEARGKSIEEWMQESAGNEVWDYGDESEVMILNNIRPSVWE